MLKELRTLLAIGRHGTFSQAGQRIGLTQSAVSAQIKRLEGALGFALFERIGRGARLTAAGHETLERASALIALYDGLQSPSALRTPATLRLGAVASVQAAALPDALARLRQAHPALRTRVVPGVSLALLGMVDTGELDAAVMVKPHLALPPELNWLPLWNEPFVLAVPQAVRGRDWRRILSTQDFIRYDRASFGGRLVTQFLEREGIDTNDVLEMDEVSGLIQSVARGLGVSLVPKCRPYFPLPEGTRALGLGASGIEREIGLLERARHPGRGLVEQLHDALRAASR